MNYDSTICAKCGKQFGDGAILCECEIQEAGSIKAAVAKKFEQGGIVPDGIKIRRLAERVDALPAGSPEQLEAFKKVLKAIDEKHQK